MEPLWLHCFLSGGKLNQSFPFLDASTLCGGREGLGLVCGAFQRGTRARPPSPPFSESASFRGKTLNLDKRVDMIAETLTASPMMMGGTLSVLQLVRGNCVRYSRNSS